MKILKLLLSSIVITVFLFSCSVEKRVHNSGYHVEWIKSAPKVDKQKKQKAIEHYVHIQKIESNSYIPSELIAGNIELTSENLEQNGNFITHLYSNSFANQSDFELELPSSDIFNISASNGEMHQVPANIKMNEEGWYNSDEVSAVTPPPGKDQLVALLLCIFLGVLGIHRFYLGYPWIGVAQLLTLGGFGIWALIDLIMIITGDLKPKNGTYSREL